MEKADEKKKYIRPKEFHT